MADAGFRRTAAADDVESVALSHLSIELGHLYVDDYFGGLTGLAHQFRRVVPWIAAARAACTVDRPRISTCLLIDDYFSRFSSPAELLPEVLAVAEECGLTIDYIARESGCVTAEGVPLADIVLSRIVSSPLPGANGARPSTYETGWLSNGQRSPGADACEATSQPTWVPPVETEAINHSIFVDLELWTGPDETRLWSCAFLAAVWQLLRLGLLRDAGANVVRPVAIDTELPDDWTKLPPIVQVNPDAAAFCAYRTTSVISARFLAVEHAVQVILGQYSPLPAVIDHIAARSRAERLELSADLRDRIDYVFFNHG
jgi:hypothetical protein